MFKAKKSFLIVCFLYGPPFADSAGGPLLTIAKGLLAIAQVGRVHTHHRYSAGHELD